MAYSDFDWITDRLAVGGFIFEPEDLPFDAVLSMETHAPTTLADLVRSGRVDYRWQSIVDGHSGESREAIVARFDDAADLIDRWLEEEKRVLVHCMAGVSRSVTAVIWYLMRYRGSSWDEALETIRAGRDIALPNIRFEAVLRTEAGETIDEVWLNAHAEEFCQQMQPWGVDDLPAEIRDHLADLGVFTERERAVS